MTDLLVLLHGLGGTGDVWVAAGSAGAAGHAPDLIGHGSADWSESYTFAGMAERVAAELPPAADSYVVLGHSLGGVVGLELARLVPSVRRVVGVGIKVEWTGDELAWARSVAERPVAWFDTEGEAVARYRKVSGVGDHVDGKVAGHGVVEEGGRWRLAQDPRTFGVGRPDMRRLLDECPAEVVLARGEHDPMQTDDQLRALSPGAVTLPGLGHNAHLEDPSAAFALV